MGKKLSIDFLLSDFFFSENSIETVETLKNKMLKLENKENHNEKHCVVCLVSEILNIISNLKKTSCKKQKIFEF